MPKPERLYFIALLPSKTIRQAAHRYKELFAEQYQSKAALKSPPHVTLHMPFKWKEDKEEKLCEVLGTFAKSKPQIDLYFEGFAAFPPKTIYIQVNTNKELDTLQAELHLTAKRSLNLFNANYRDRPFRPHLTVAFRDLKKEQFEHAWPIFENKAFSQGCTVKEMTLLKHNGQHWEVFQEFPFQ